MTEEAKGFADFNKSLDPAPKNLIVGEFVVQDALEPELNEDLFPISSKVDLRLEEPSLAPMFSV